ncbi:MAG: hydantoin utilization protein [Thermomicrobiales bacterium]|nr:hydantoin utilization protein [Thermomicrobiales bacterium]
MPVDNVLLEIMKNRFQAIVGEMGQAIQRTGHTVFIKETADFGSVLVSPAGEIFAAPLNIGVTVLIGTPMDSAIKAVSDYQDGDVLISNDPTSTGAMATHLPDLYVWKPIFVDGELLCFAWTFIHASDVGGKVPGSISPTSADIQQEGLVIPPTKLFRQGELNQEFLDLFLANCRIPDQNWGDLKALIAALNVGETRTRQLVDRYGKETVQAAMDGVLDYAESQARHIISSIPDGTYRFHDYMEGEQFGVGTIRIELALTVSGSDIVMDFTGTDPQVPASLNIPTHGKRGHWMIVPALVKYFKTANMAITYNSGMVRPIELDIPRQTLLNPDPGAACGVRAATMFRVFDVVCGALAQAIPHDVPAAGSGQGCIVLVSLVDLTSGNRKISVVQPLCGGCGGRPAKDGIDGVDFSLGSLRNVPTESLESEMPLLITRYGLRPDSCGHGQHRGGNGVELMVRIFTPHTVMTARGMERYFFRPWGLNGGTAGTTGFTRLRQPGRDWEEIGQIDVLHLDPGSEVHFGTQGGGGWGNPLARPLSAVEQDIAEGLVSESVAATAYGLVFSDGHIDAAASSRLRAELQRRSPSAADLFDFGPERATYEAIWSDDVHAAINTALERVAPALRYFVRGQLIEAIRQDGATADVAAGRVPVLLEQVHERLALRNLSSNTSMGAAQAPDDAQAAAGLIRR